MSKATTPSIEHFSPEVQKIIGDNANTYGVLYDSLSIVDGKPELDKDKAVSIFTPEKIEALTLAGGILNDIRIAGTAAFGTRLNEYYKNHPEATDRVSISLPLVGKDTMDFHYTPKAEHSVVGKPGEKSVSYGRIVSSHEQYEADSKRGDLGKLTKELAAIAKKNILG
jgi:hypothetical protein